MNPLLGEKEKAAVKLAGGRERKAPDGLATFNNSMSLLIVWAL